MDKNNKVESDQGDACELPNSCSSLNETSSNYIDEDVQLNHPDPTDTNIEVDANTTSEDVELSLHDLEEPIILPLPYKIQEIVNDNAIEIAKSIVEASATQLCKYYLFYLYYYEHAHNLS